MGNIWSRSPSNFIVGLRANSGSCTSFGLRHTFIQPQSSACVNLSTDSENRQLVDHIYNLDNDPLAILVHLIKKGLNIDGLDPKMITEADPPKSSTIRRSKTRSSSVAWALTQSTAGSGSLIRHLEAFLSPKRGSTTKSSHCRIFLASRGANSSTVHLSKPRSAGGAPRESRKRSRLRRHDQQSVCRWQQWSGQGGT